MEWLISASAAALVLLIGVSMSRRARRRRVEESEPVAPSPPAETQEVHQRVRRFLQTGSHRLVEPESSASDLRPGARTVLQAKDVAADAATLDAFLADVRDASGADEAVFWRWSEERDTLMPWAWSTVGEPRPKYFDMNAWGPLVKWAAEGRMLHFDADARIAVTRLAAAPIEHDGRLVGVLSVARAEGLERGRESLKSWLPRHAAQIGRLMSLFELRREYGRYMLQSRALLAAATYVQGHKSQEALGRAICDTALQVSSASDAALVRWRSDLGRGWVQYATGGFKHRPPFPLTTDSLVSRAMTEGATWVHEDVGRMTGRVSLFTDNDDAWTKGPVAILPLVLDDRVIGGLVVAATQTGALSREESHNVALLAALAAPSLEMVWEMEEVSRRARTDSLTGLANRRAFDEQLESLVAHADRFGHSVSLIVADVDNFKDVNDNHGHDVGDAVLRSIAARLSETVRAVDVCARFGGEEFAVVLPQTTLTGAVELAERLRRAVAGTPTMVGESAISVTLSCGVACYPEGVLTKEALFAAADRAMYEAKTAGRNCVKAAVPKPTGVVR